MHYIDHGFDRDVIGHFDHPGQSGDVLGSGSFLVILLDLPRQCDPGPA